jgi:hypothetical protein
MKRGKDLRNLRGEPVERNAANEVAGLMFVLVERSPGDRSKTPVVQVFYSRSLGASILAHSRMG